MPVGMFPGQGAQKKAMGVALLSKYPEYVNRANEVLGYDLQEIILDNPDGKLDQTHYTQPALYLVNTLNVVDYRANNHGAYFDCFIGHSLGEFNALMAAGAFDFETGLVIVKKRAELMAKVKNGAMSALIGFNLDQVRALLEELNITESVNVANYNAYEQVVVSGIEDDIDAVNDAIRNKQAGRCIKLNVSGAFHSSLMESVSVKFKRYLKKIKFNELRIPVVSNYSGQPYQNDKIAENLSKQVSGQVKWVQSVEYLLREGQSEFCELGPGSILTNLVKSIQKSYVSTS